MDTPHNPNSREPEAVEDDNIAKMALYSLTRAHTALSTLSHLPTWTNADTASFDCMHYDGDAALDHCAATIGIQPSQHILDIGSGFGATGRYLASKYHVSVTGVELQRDIHELALLITARNVDGRVVEGVRSVCGDFLTVEDEVLGGEGVRFDHAVSFLCITHMSEGARRPLFKRVAGLLRVGGKVYVEDFYRRGDLSEDDLWALRHVLACSYLPSRAEFVAEVAEAGFGEVVFRDVSRHWTRLLVARAEKYRMSEGRSVELQVFYDTVAELFVRGGIGGVRLSAVRA